MRSGFSTKVLSNAQPLKGRTRNTIYEVYLWGLGTTTPLQHSNIINFLKLVYVASYTDYIDYLAFTEVALLMLNLDFCYNIH